jgi:hypothetical protein
MAGGSASFDGETSPEAAPRSLPSAVASLSLLGGGMAAVALGALVLMVDPGEREEQVFVGLLLVLMGGLGTTCMLLFGRRSASPMADTGRAVRRGVLFGLACGGAAALQFAKGLSAPNLGFLLLVLLIVEMIFLARRQHPYS